MTSIPPAAEAARPLARGAYSGEVGAGADSIEFTVSPNRLALSIDVLTVTAPCTNGRDYTAVLEGRLRVRTNGRFSGRVEENLETEPFVTRSDAVVSGRFTDRGRRASGRIRSRVEGEGGTSCDSGSTAFMARLAGRRRAPRLTG